MSYSTFLTSEELIYLTGRKQKSKQAKELQRLRISFHFDAFKRPIVLRENVEVPQYKKSSSAIQNKELDFSFINKL